MTGRPPYDLFRVIVERARLITPHMKRITIDGTCLSDFRFGLPAQWLKVFVPEPGSDSVVGRAFTIRRFDPISKKLDIDFVLHSDSGPASAWAARAQVGDVFEVSAAHPRSGLPIDAETRHYWLFGDATALPAINGILEALPARARARVFVKVDDASDEQPMEVAAHVNYTWLHRDGAGNEGSRCLQTVAKSLGSPGEGTIVWVAAESSIVKAVRRHALMVWRVDRSSVHAVGYWKRGQSDHKEVD